MRGRQLLDQGGIADDNYLLSEKRRAWEDYYISRRLADVKAASCAKRTRASALLNVRVQQALDVEDRRTIQGFEAPDEHAGAVDGGDGHLVQP